MANLREIKRRAGSVKNTQQITRAMKMVAAAKLRGAQDAILALRPYSKRLHKLLLDLAGYQKDGNEPLLSQRPVKKILTVVFSSDRGLCGGFNSNIIRETEAMMEQFKKNEAHVSYSFAFAGKKAYQYFKRRNVPIYKYYDDVISSVSFEKARDMADEWMEAFLSGEFDEIQFVYNEFKSAIAQEVENIVYLPIRLSEVIDAPTRSMDFTYEPNQEEIFTELLPRYFHTQVYRVLLESIASEHGARMSAMESATKNAGEMIKSLNLQYNRARQAAITTEILEITSGAEALK